MAATLERLPLPDSPDCTGIASVDDGVTRHDGPCPAHDDPTGDPMTPEQLAATAEGWASAHSVGDLLVLLAGRRTPTGGKFSEADALALARAIGDELRDNPQRSALAEFAAEFGDYRSYGWTVEQWNPGEWLLRDPDGDQRFIGNYGGVAPTKAAAELEAYTRIAQDAESARILGIDGGARAFWKGA